MYDVALSFASEQRRYVQEVAKYLKKYGKNVFYDDFEKDKLWGKNLHEHLHEIYKNESEYIIMFLSNEYKNKEWTRHERRASQERAFIQSTECILPVRFDDTEIPGLNTTTGYLDATRLLPKDIAQIFIQKTGGKLVSTVESVPVNEESSDYPISYKKSVYLWHTTSIIKPENDLIERCQVQVIVDTDSDVILNKIDKVIYYLHPTFPNNKITRESMKDRYLLKFSAWGSFQLKAEVFFLNFDKPLVLYRYINLHTF